MFWMKIQRKFPLKTVRIMNKRKRGLFDLFFYANVWQ